MLEFDTFINAMHTAVLTSMAIPQVFFSSRQKGGTNELQPIHSNGL